MVESKMQPRVAPAVPPGSVELLGRAIHRVRNLMMSIRGYAELIALSSVGHEDHQRWAARIVDQVDVLEALNSRVDGALREAPELSDHSMALITRAALERSDRRRAPGEAVGPVRIEVLEDCIVHADGEDVAEAIAALIDNARDASGGGAVEIRLGRDDGRDWCLSVTDHGPGCAPEDFARLGEPFFTRKAGHLGLGLFLGRSLLDRHGLQLDFEPGPAGGTVATIRDRR